MAERTSVADRRRVDAVDAREGGSRDPAPLGFSCIDSACQGENPRESALGFSARAVLASSYFVTSLRNLHEDAEPERPSPPRTDCVKGTCRFLGHHSSATTGPASGRCGNRPWLAHAHRRFVTEGLDRIECLRTKLTGIAWPSNEPPGVRVLGEEAPSVSDLSAPKRPRPAGLEANSPRC